MPSDFLWVLPPLVRHPCMQRQNDQTWAELCRWRTRSMTSLWLYPIRALISLSLQNEKCNECSTCIIYQTMEKIISGINFILKLTRTPLNKHIPARAHKHTHMHSEIQLVYVIYPWKLITVNNIMLKRINNHCSACFITCEVIHCWDIFYTISVICCGQI